MTFDEVFAAVLSSNRSDWHHIEGELFLETGGDDPQGHRSLAAFKPNVNISLAWGLTCREDFNEEWVRKCPDPSASSEYVDLRFAGSPIYRAIYVVVDGGRAMLPLPRAKDMTVPENYLRFIRLLSAGAYDEMEYVRRLGLQVTDQPWPRT